ncbi:type II toxin-antitoxin system Phd/YefM family antitoxin [Nitratireductor luteus]|uniref:type II toxin-antitoxin system Phd/YefM family antitoxin n=1 Tax=Nitratireductor luteus TaxID=2976980 RepID=UPI00223EB880|nr:type II toxin-antitoxin system prevent-host-death family antitoxin [Nitratireductor luteus]
MKTVPATEAKAKFSALLSDVERGEIVSITRHGRTIARMVPEESKRPEEVRRAVENIRKLRASLPKTGITIEEVLSWRHEGHRY